MLGADLDVRFSRFQKVLAWLDEHDRPLQGADDTAPPRSTFGSGIDDYRPRPVAAESLEAFEDAIEVQLPSEFRRFLVRIGTGTGPGYGVYSIDQMSLRWRATCDSAPRCGMRPPAPSKPFPFSEDELSLGFSAKFPFQPDGTVEILTEGCSGYFLLVTAGELRGTVWSFGDDQLVRRNLNPSGAWKEPRSYDLGLDPDHLAVPALFVDWYENWLDHAVDVVRSRYELRADASNV